MRTLAELSLLLSESISLLVRFFPTLVFWFCGGWALHEVGMLGSVLLGADHAGWATLAFIAGVIAYAGSLVLMLHSLKDGLRSAAAARALPTQRLRIPDQVFARESRVAVFALALGPFLAIYTLWGLADDEVGQLFEANALVHGNAGTTEWSVNLTANLPLYLGLAAGAWVVKQLGLLLTRRFPTVLAALATTAADGVFVFASFVALLRLTSLAAGWAQSRNAWVALRDGWNAFLSWLPDLRLPFDLVLPEALRQLVAWTWRVLVPGVAENVALPLMWLALAATVFGWREFRARDVLSGLPLPRSERLARLPGVRHSRFTAWVTTDLRHKYLPLAQALRLIWYAGPRFLGAYLLLATVLRLLDHSVRYLLQILPGPGSPSYAVGILPLLDLVAGLIFTSWSVTLYAAAFDRSVADVTGLPDRRGRVAPQPAAR